MKWKKIKIILRNILCGLFIIIAAIIISLTKHLQDYFNSAYFEQLLYNVLNATSFNLETVYSSVTFVILGAIIIVAICFLPLIIQCFFNPKLKFKLLKKEIVIFPINFKKYASGILIISLIIIGIKVGVPNYIINNLSSSSLYENYYVEYDSEMLTFPSEKQNLITIYVESLETSIFSYENGGNVKESYMPKLESLALNYTNFSNTDLLGGFKRVNGTDWTSAGIVAQTAGVPIYVKTTNNKGNFLEGATSIGDILASNGYKNYLMIGSDASFGQKDAYFSEHGTYSIYDYDYAKEAKYIVENYYVWWGYEDGKLFEFAKKELAKISEEDEPFNFTLLTTDTHFFDGYIEQGCEIKFDNKYANSYYCSDSLITSFIAWIQEQDFYENTTIVIVGDHLGMRDSFYSDDDDAYTRTVFNLFINSRVSTDNTKNRDFTAFDMFPTTLAALGVEIEGDRLALGTNLFSSQKTLAEELGYEKFAKEIAKRSKYYNKNILKK